MPSNQLPLIHFAGPVIQAQKGQPVAIPVFFTVFNQGASIVCLNLSGTSPIYFVLNGGHSNSVCLNKTITATGVQVQLVFNVTMNSSAPGVLWSQIQCSITDSNHRASSNTANLHLT